MRCEDPKQGISFCVVSDLAVFLNSNNLDLQLNREIKFEYPEDDAIFDFDEEKNENKKKRKRGRKPAPKPKMTYFGTLINKSGELFIFSPFSFIQDKFL